MSRVLSRLAIPVLAALLSTSIMLASSPRQTRTINVLSTENHDCVGLSFSPIRSTGHLYTMRLAAPDRCAGCRVQEMSAKILFDADYCKYKISFVRARNVQSIRIRESVYTVVLKGPDESSLRRFFATMCVLGGVPLPIGKPIRLEQEVDGIAIEFENGALAGIEAPLPMNATATALDSCGHHAFAIIPISPK